MQYVQTGTNPDGTPRYEMRTAFSPEQQALYQKQTGVQGGEADLASALLGAKRGALSGNPLDLSENATETRLNQLYHGQNDPIVAQQREALMQQLYNRGVREGQPAYDTAMRNFEDQNARNADRPRALAAAGVAPGRSDLVVAIRKFCHDEATDGPFVPVISIQPCV